MTGMELFRSARQLNSRQKKIRDSWRELLWAFAKREWLSVFSSTSLAVLAAGAVHLFWRDQALRSFVVKNYLPLVLLDEPRYYLYRFVILFLALVLALGPWFCVNSWRGLRSWATGVASGLVLVPFSLALLFSTLPSSGFHHRFVEGTALIGLCFLSSFLMYLNSEIRRERGVREDELRVPASVRSLAGTQVQESDDPIQSWAQDALGRASLIDSLSIKIMIAKSPVLWLSGTFGSGKTSTLNLLREHLGDTTITVSFSSWLPGSAETLTSYLLADIANECKKRYVVPGLRQSTRRLAAALGRRVPVLSDYLKLLPGPTQKDDIDNLRSALVRLPKRVVVLLDEIDRMEKEELITLLKVIRGISSLPNLSFVCAGDRETIMRTIDKNTEYFEKFYPVLIPVTDPDTAALRKAGTERLVSVFVRHEWFETEPEVDQFRRQIEGVWETRIAPFCRNLRAIGLLANDVSVAAAPLKREVDAVDLTLIEMLRRFRPVIYELVARNSVALTGGESLVRGGSFQTDEDRTRIKTKFMAELKEALPKGEEFESVRDVLYELFPFVSTGSGRLERRQRPKRTDSEEESDKRIREPGMFPAYFRYELPDAIFSSVELAWMLHRFEHAADQAAREGVFVDTLLSMGKGSLKRDDFLRKLADAGKSISTSAAKGLAEAAVKSAAQYTYDLMAPFAEAGHVLRMILFVAQRLSQADRVAFLQGCVLKAGDDTMALRIVTVLTHQKDDSNIGVSIPDLYRSFTGRMRTRYGPDVDAVNMDLSSSDPWAFEFWGRVSVDGITADPEDRKIQCDFWLRHIGNSKARLADAFKRFFLPIAAYSTDPAPLVENRISLADLRRLYELPDHPALTDSQRKSLETLRRLLAGEFKNGIGPTSKLW